MGVNVEDFSADILGQAVNFHVIKMQKSFFLWVGVRPSLKTLAVAMKTRFDEQPISTQLLGGATDVTSSTLAKKLGSTVQYFRKTPRLPIYFDAAKKTDCQCFVSVNISDPSLYLATELHIMRIIERDPRTFFNGPP